MSEMSEIKSRLYFSFNSRFAIEYLKKTYAILVYEHVDITWSQNKNDDISLIVSEARAHFMYFLECTLAAISTIILTF